MQLIPINIQVNIDTSDVMMNIFNVHYDLLTIN